MTENTRSRSSRPRKVLIAARCSETIYRQRLVLARALRDAGWEVHLCGDASIQDYIKVLAEEGFKFHPLKLDQQSRNPLAAIRLLHGYRKIVRTIRPDIVHVFNAKPTVFGLLGSALALRTARVATIAGLGHVFMSQSRLLRAMGTMAFRGALMLADAVIFYNHDDEQLFIDENLIPARKAALIRGSGIDLERFSPTPLPNGKQLEILFVGRLLREKGITEVLACARELAQRAVSLRITIVGDVDHHNPSSLTLAEIEQAASDGLVRWLGSQNDIVPILAASDVVILPSHREGIPLALIEGAAMRRALVATDVPGCRDVVLHEESGLLVPLGSASRLADALMRLEADRSLVDRLAGNALIRVRLNFESSVISSQVVALYDRVLAERGRASHRR